MINSRRMRLAGHVERMGAKRNAYRILVGKSERKRPLGRTRRTISTSVMPHLMEAEVTLNAVGCEEHFAFACEYKQEAVQRLKHNGLL
jgi:hypothetical protein